MEKGGGIFHGIKFFAKTEFSEARRTRSPRCAGAANDEFRDLAPSPIDRWGSKLALSGSDSASPPVAYSPNSRNSPTVCPGTPGGTLAIENYLRDLHIRILQRTAVN